MNVRIGQFAADEEFLTSDVAGVFLNSTFGWPGINAVDLPAGGPAYPFSTPGIRVRYTPADAFSLQAAAFNGNPLGQHGDQGGIEFPLDGVFAIVEASYSTRPGKGEPGLGGTFKIGAWYNSLHFDDLHIDNIGLSLADPAGSGIPACTPAITVFMVRSITCCGARPAPRMVGCPASCDLQRHPGRIAARSTSASTPA